MSIKLASPQPSPLIFVLTTQKFFKQECSILRSFHRSVGWGIMHTATSFECYIANHLPVEGREAQNRALARLPPSVAQGEARFDKTGKLYMQPLIEFSVSVSVSYRGVSGTETIKNIELHCPITMASSMDFEPPLYQALTCEQQSNTCHTWLRKNRLAPKFAEVEVGLSMHGTEPLRSSPGCSIQHTKRYLQVSWAPKHTSTPQTETTVTLHVESILVSKTCYGALLSDDFPNAQQLRCEAVKLRSKIIKLGTRKCQFVIPQSANTTISPANPYYALLLLPIQSSIVVPPSFATAHATRDYTLRVTVSFKGFCQGALALEAGLQVNQCFETKQPPERVISALRLTETNMEENTEVRGPRLQCFAENLLILMSASSALCILNTTQDVLLTRAQ